MTFHISTFASDDEGSYKNHPHWSWEPLWAQSVYTYIVMFEASYPLIIGERWLRANSWPAAGLAPSSLLLSPMLRMCVCFSAAASSCCSLFPVWPAGGAEQASGRDDGGGAALKDRWSIPLHPRFPVWSMIQSAVSRLGSLWTSSFCVYIKAKNL